MNFSREWKILGAMAAIFGLAVCSCSVLPMFAGIYNLGTGLGPASAFLYSGPAINVLAIFLTARVLGFELGIWRAAGAIVLAVLVGLGMHTLFRGEERKKGAAAAQMPEPPPATRPAWQSALLLVAMIAFLVFSDWFNPGDAIVHLTDGSQIRGVVLQEMHDEVMIQVQETGQGVRAGERITVPKTEIAEAKSWVEVYVRAYPGAGSLIQVSQDGGDGPVWSPDGAMIYYTRGRDYMAAPFIVDSGAPAVSAARVSFRVDGSVTGEGDTFYDLTPDGEAFVVVEPFESGALELRLIRGWVRELEQLVPHPR